MVAQNDHPDPNEEQVKDEPCAFDGLKPMQERAIVALLHETTIRRAATVAEVSERSILRWMTQPKFSRAYRQARREAFMQAIGMTQRYAPLAVNTLAKIIADPDAPAHARVSAATAILRFGREGIEIDDLAACVESLEEAAEKAAEKAKAGEDHSRWH